MPYAFQDRGTNYFLTDHASIGDLISNASLTDTRNWSKVLRKKFPDDRELSSYLESLDKWHEKASRSQMKLLREIESELKESGGELYHYKVLGRESHMGGGQMGVEVEDGLLILLRHRVVKRWAYFGSGQVDKAMLEEDGLLKKSPGGSGH